MNSALTGHHLIRAFLLLGLTAVVACSPFWKSDPDKAMQQIVEARAEERALVMETIEEPERSAYFLSLIDERNVLESQYRAIIRNHLQSLTALSVEYHSPRAKFEEAFRTFNREHAWVQSSYINLIEKMKHNTTASEWKIIGKYQLSELKPRVISQQGIRSMYK